MRLVAVILNVGPNFFAGRGINNGNVKLFSASKKSREDTVNAAYTIIEIGDSRMLLGCGDSAVKRLIHLIYVASERKNVVIVVGSGRSSCVVVRFYLIILVNSIVVSLGLNLIVVKVEDGSLAPIAEKSEEGRVKVNTVILCRIKSKESFNVHTVLKG